MEDVKNALCYAQTMIKLIQQIKTTGLIIAALTVLTPMPSWAAWHIIDQQQCIPLTVFFPNDLVTTNVTTPDEVIEQLLAAGHQLQISAIQQNHGTQIFITDLHQRLLIVDQLYCPKNQ